MTLPPEIDLVLSRTPSACTLPTAERPLRLAEFDEVFRSGARSVTRLEPGRARLELEPSPEMCATVASLVVRETRCCSSSHSRQLRLAEATGPARPANG